MDGQGHRAFRVLLAHQGQVGQEATRVLQEILATRAGQDPKVNVATPASPAPELYRGRRDLLVQQVKREKGAMTVSQVSLESQDPLV